MRRFALALIVLTLAWAGPAGAQVSASGNATTFGGALFEDRDDGLPVSPVGGFAVGITIGVEQSEDLSVPDVYVGGESFVVLGAQETDVYAVGKLGLSPAPNLHLYGMYGQAWPTPAADEVDEAVNTRVYGGGISIVLLGIVVDGRYLLDGRSPDDGDRGSFGVVFGYAGG